MLSFILLDDEAIIILSFKLPYPSAATARARDISAVPATTKGIDTAWAAAPNIAPTPLASNTNPPPARPNPDTILNKPLAIP